MRLSGGIPLALTLFNLAVLASVHARDLSAVPLPEGVQAVWDVRLAYHETTFSRERICINGLWLWQPAGAAQETVPGGRWGYFKVPGSWPGITNYMQKDCQTVHAHPDWKDENISRITAAWYQRDITIPQGWSGRRITLSAEYLNSYAAVYVDGANAGEIRFPGGEVDLTSVCRPGGRHVLSLLVVAMPLKGVMLSYNDTASARTVKGSVDRRGLCGDVYLVSTPAGPRLTEVKVGTSVRRRELTLDAALKGLAPDVSYTLRARITKNGRAVKKFTSRVFKGGDLKDGWIAFARAWMPRQLWDLHTPQHMYHLELSLAGPGGVVLDTAHPVRFGFREFWIEGRDFFLNGTRIFCSVLPVDNAQVGAMLASYAGARETLERLKRFGFNAVYTHNYGCEPGSHLGFTEILRAADDVGILVFFSQPHFGHYDWDAPDAGQANGYARHARFFVRMAQNHPSVVMYAMSHNGAGYSEDMSPDLMDGSPAPRDTWSLNNSKRARRAEAIVKRLDSTRIIYHHSAGNLGSVHTTNFYANFVPVQEQSDWFEGWATQGVKPLFLCEYGVPLSWDWTMFRGWYKGERSFGSGKVPWEFCQAEWSAQFLGDRAFQISEWEKANLRWEARQFRAGNLWHRWDYPTRVGSNRFADRHEIFARYFTDNLRAFRAWGLSGFCVWDHGHFWKLRDNLEKGRRDFDTDWRNLQRPGFSPDYVDERYERFDLAFERADWTPTAAGRALIRNNGPLLSYIGGKSAEFTSKDHNFHPGETVEKQLIIVNNSRETVTGTCTWSFDLPKPVTGRRRFRLFTGEQKRIPLRLVLPGHVRSGTYTLAATVRFSNGESQQDSFAVHILPPLPPPEPDGKIALFDPRGETAESLSRLKVSYDRVEADADLSGYDLLIVGKAALTVAGPGPDIDRVRAGLKVVMFEQSSAVLEQRFGFRVAEYGLRRVFRRVADHPLLAGLDAEHLRDWRGEATILPPRLTYELNPRHGPTITWCGIPVTRPWRCGCRGNVASVLIEKPVRGDFLPVLDGGFSLQYSPLLEYHEGLGVVLFCQMDVTGRTERDPAADRLLTNILSYMSRWKPAPRRNVLYAGEPAGKRHLESAGLSVGSYMGGAPAADQVLVVGPDGGPKLEPHAAVLRAWIKAGGSLVAVGIGETEANAFLPFKVRMKTGEHIASFFEGAGRDSFLAGVGPADVHNRDPRELHLVSAGAEVVGNGVLAKAKHANVVFCQLVPWQFESGKNYGRKRTWRRASFLLSRLLANVGVAGSTPLLARCRSTLAGSGAEQRWLDGLYLDTPVEWDDPYRFFRW